MRHLTTADWIKVRLEPAFAEIVSRYTSEIPVRVGALANELGLEVARAPLHPSVSGLIQPSERTQSKFEIKVNKYEVPERQRFTVAHEIGHYLLHRSEIGAGVHDTIMYRSGLSSNKEVEANRFAADLLMPSAAIATELKRLGGTLDPDTVEELARIFKVSVPAMKVRLGVPL